MAPTAPQSPSALIAQVRGQWGALGAGQRRTVVLVGAMVLVAVLVGGALAARGPAMAPLYTNLSLQDGAAIVTQLQQSKVPYKLANNGATILVPKSEVDNLRLQLAGKGLPNHGAVGLSSVLSLPFGATSFTRQVAYQEALQGELEQTIDDIQGVSSSRVQIVMPQTSAFGGPTPPSSAAVLLNLQPGVTLSASQVEGVARLVAASVQGLSTSNVTVVNQIGDILWSQGAASGGSASSTTAASGQAAQDLQVTQTYDQQLQSQLQSLLDQVFGPGNVVTHVQADMTFNQGTIDSTTYQPGPNGQGVVQKLQALRNSLSGGSATGGIAGTATNSFPTYTSTSGAGAGKTSGTGSSSLTEDFVINQTTTHTVEAPGTVSRLSVAVVVNGTLTAAQQQLVTQTVQAAVGYSAARQDQITVVGMPFNKSLVKTLQAQPTAVPLGVPTHFVYEGAGAAIALIAGLLVLMALRKPKSEPAGAVGGGGHEPLRSPSEPLAAPEEEEDPFTTLLEGARRSRERMQGALRQQPEDVARVVRVWLSQDD